MPVVVSAKAKGPVVDVPVDVLVDVLLQLTTMLVILLVATTPEALDMLQIWLGLVGCVLTETW